MVNNRVASNIDFIFTTLPCTFLSVHSHPRNMQ